MRLQPGSEFEGYIIERQLGAGGMGRVYLARHPRLKRLIALKVLDEALADDPRVRYRFEQEAELAARLDHPNIVTVYDRNGAGSPGLWLSMKYVDGGDIAALIASRANGLDVHHAVQIITGAARGLDHAHRHGIVHRDVKPANLLIERDVEGGEHVLVTDFGIARALDDSTTTTGVVATIAYTAPSASVASRSTHAPTSTLSAARSTNYSLAENLFRTAIKPRSSRPTSVIPRRGHPRSTANCPAGSMP
ncbi:serine/threonine-protein kinase [Nocardia sp. NPDC052566]|uniref:serine/threonine-protein kinase n=1 Tax=Nocardia sp. NPDC052566 TaxID=3364330 RepID=UPI0037C7ADE9